MRHIILIGSFTLMMALLTTVAFQMDQSRNLASQQALEQQIDQDLLRLERQFLEQAILLITVQDKNDPLLWTLENARSGLPAIADSQSRDTEFQSLVARVKARTLKAPVGDETSLQEWRRAQDQLNGTLHRHRVLLQRLEESH